MNAAATLDSVRDWPVEDQLDLVFRLWDQIVDAGWRPTLEPGLLDELHRRLDAHTSDPTQALTWEQVVSHIRRKR
ncbi:MAG TPA: addiction module protein [Gemmata sp.]|nr:addiction module protein [Gemmata sp.]